MKIQRFQALILAAVFLLATGAAVALAHGPDDGNYGYGTNCPGYGMGNGGGQGMGMGPGMMGHGRRGGNLPELTKEQQDQLDAVREKFWSENRKLRRDIEDKQEELYKELGKEKADESKVLALQKELSKLESDFDQKAIQHKLEVHKIAPDAFRGQGGYHRGPGGGRHWR